MTNSTNDHRYLVRPWAVLWAQIKVLLITMWSFQRVVTVSESSTVKGCPWLVLSFHVLYIESEDGTVFYESPHCTKEYLAEVRAAWERVFLRFRQL